MEKYMREHHIISKDKISADATSNSEKHDRTVYHQDYYISIVIHS